MAFVQREHETARRLEVLRQVLNYSPSIGVLTWKHRNCDTFPELPTQDAQKKAARFNCVFSGKPAGHLTKHRRVVVCHNDEHYRGERVAYALANGHWPVGEVKCLDGCNMNLTAKNLIDLGVRTPGTVLH